MPGARIRIYISHNGSDQIGTAFLNVLKRELSLSGKYELGVEEESAKDRRLRFFINLNTMGVPSKINDRGQYSAVSVVVEDMGLPNSYPVPYMWYHKVFVLEPNHGDEMAKTLISDMDAHWCRIITDSVGGCPKESLSPMVR